MPKYLTSDFRALLLRSHQGDLAIIGQAFAKLRWHKEQRFCTVSVHQDDPPLLLFFWAPSGGGRGNSMINSRAGQGGRGMGNFNY